MHHSGLSFRFYLKKGATMLILYVQNGHHRVLALKKAFPSNTPFFCSHIYVLNEHTKDFLKKLSYNDDDNSVPDFISARFDRLKGRFRQYFL